MRVGYAKSKNQITETLLKTAEALVDFFWHSARYISILKESRTILHY